MPEQSNFFQQDAPSSDGGYSLRYYQRDALNAIKAARDRGVRRQLMMLPTGAGKTVAFARLPETLGIKRMLVMAHVTELLDQAAEKIVAANPKLRVGIEQASRAARQFDPIVIASVQTLTGKGKRLERWSPEDFDALVIDEAHRSLAPTYMEVVRHFRAGEKDGPLLLGVTATPFRGDGIGLSSLYEELVYSIDMDQLMTEGYLCDAIAKVVRTTTDISDVKTSSTGDKDFIEKEIIKRTSNDDRQDTICSAIEDYAGGRRTILVFVPGVAQVADLVQRLVMRGHQAEGITGDTDANLRSDTMGRFRSGETRILVNCAVFTHGLDVPEIDCIVMGRPTKSALLGLQMVGRGMRPAQGKENLLILDVVDICGAHHIMTAAAMFGMGRYLDLDQRSVLDTKKNLLPLIEDTGLKIDQGDTAEDVEKRIAVVLGTRYIETKAEATALFSSLEVASEIATRSQFPWIEINDNLYLLPVERGRNCELRRDAMGTWTYKHLARTEVLGDFAKPPFGKVDHRVRRDAGMVTTKDGRTMARWRAMKLDAKWHHDPASEGQIAFLRKLGVRYLPDVYDHLGKLQFSKGAAANAITRIQLIRELKKHAKTPGNGRDVGGGGNPAVRVDQRGQTGYVGDRPRLAENQRESAI